MLAKDVKLATTCGFPHHDVAIAITGGQQHAIRTEGGAHHPLGVLADDIQFFTGGGVIDLHLFRGAADHHHLVIRADVRAHDLVKFLAHFDDAFAGLHIPDNGVTEFASAAAPHHKQGAIATEAQTAGITFGVWENTGQLLGVGVVKQDLLWCRKGDQGCPWACRHGDHRGGAWRHHDWFQQYMLRLGDRTRRLAARHSHRHIDFGFARFLGHAGLRLQHAARDPFGQDIQFFGTQRRAFRRHERFFFLRTTRPETAGAWIARVDDGTTAAASHQGAHAGQVQIALLFIRIVAGETFVFQQRPDLVFIGDLFPILSEGRRRKQGEAGQ